MRDQVKLVQTRVGSNIRQLRRARSLSLEQLAELTGTSAKHLGNVERGSANVSLAILAKIAARLSVEVAELCTAMPAGTRRPRTIVLTDEEFERISRVVDKVKRRRR